MNTNPFSSRYVGGPFEAVLPAYTSVFMSQPKKLDDGDKIILPEGVLRNLMSRPGTQHALPEPLLFEIKNVKYGATSHCGVLEFSADKHHAILPQWMMENLVLEPGMHVKLRLKQLPKLTFVKFKPDTHSFSTICNPKTVLEIALHKFTTLTLGDAISIEHGGRRFTLHVTEIEPKRGEPAAGCIVDADLRVEFDVPVEEKGPDAPPRLLTFDTEVKDTIESDSYLYFKFKLIDPAHGVTINLVAVEGDPDLYVSTSTERPTISHHDRAANDSGSVQLTFRPGEAGFSDSWYFVGVHSYKTAASFALTVSEAQPAVSSSSSVNSGQATGSVSDNARGPTKQCENCARAIPEASFTMHALQCARINWRCPKCGEVLKKSEASSHAHCAECGKPMRADQLEKHVELTHKCEVCECGKEVVRDLMALHKSEECKFRPSKCIYCEVSLPHNQLHEHESNCGGRTEPCQHCNRPVARTKLHTHYSTCPALHPVEVPESSPSRSSASESTRNYEDDDIKMLPPVERSTTDDRVQSALQQSLNDQQILEDRQFAEAMVQSARNGNTSPDSQPSTAQSSAGHSSHLRPSRASQSCSSRVDLTTHETTIDLVSDDECVEIVRPVMVSTSEMSPKSHVSATGLGFHDSVCPYCSKQVSLDEDFDEHLMKCGEMDES
eukprot:396665_1